MSHDTLRERLANCPDERSKLTGLIADAIGNRERIPAARRVIDVLLDAGYLAAPSNTAALTGKDDHDAQA